MAKYRRFIGGADRPRGPSLHLDRSLPYDEVDAAIMIKLDEQKRKREKREAKKKGRPITLPKLSFMEGPDLSKDKERGS